MVAVSAVLAAIPVSDFEKSRDFYGGTLGLSATMEIPGMVIYSTAGGRLMVFASAVPAPSEATRAVLAVADLDASVAELKAAGVTFEHYPDLPMTTWDGDIATWQLPSGDMPQQRSAWFKDPDGHILNIGTEP